MTDEISEDDDLIATMNRKYPDLSEADIIELFTGLSCYYPNGGAHTTLGILAHAYGPVGDAPATALRITDVGYRYPDER